MMILNNGKKVSQIGLGSWAFGGSKGPGLGEQSDLESARVIEKALELGLNWIDTAPVYGLGHAESIIGKTIKTRRKDFFIASKSGICFDKRGSIFYSLTKRTIREELEMSLIRLDIDEIDLYQIHRPLPEAFIEEAWEEFVKLKMEGKVKYIGVTNFNLEQLKKIDCIHPIDTLQIQYSIYNKEIDPDLLNFCLSKKIKIIGHSPLHMGILTNKMSKEYIQNLSIADIRKSSFDINSYETKLLLKSNEKLKRIAFSHNMSLSQLAKQWVIQQNFIDYVLIGARNIDQLIDLLPIDITRLTNDELRKIKKILNKKDNLEKLFKSNLILRKIYEL